MNGKINWRRWAVILPASAALTILGGCAVVDPWDIGEPTSYYDDGYYNAYPDYYYGAPATSVFMSGYTANRSHRARGHHRQRDNRADRARRDHSRRADRSNHRSRASDRARRQNNVDFGYSRSGSGAARGRGGSQLGHDFGYSRP